MSIGISTASFYPLETERAIALLAEKGIKTTEIFVNAPRELKPSFADYILDIIRGSDLKITAINPM